MKKLLFLFTITSLFSCKQKENPQPTFSLIGKTDKIENGQYVYLHDLVNNSTLDSAKIVNNEFEFHTQLKQTPVFGIIHNKKRNLFREIWLEDQPMTFNDFGADFNNAVVKGSKTDSLATRLSHKNAGLEKAEIIKNFKNFVKNHPNSILSAEILYSYGNKWGKNFNQKVYDNFSEETKNSLFGKKVSERIKNDKSPGLGEHVPEISLPNPNGKIETLNENKGKYTLVEFWASSCKPCRISNPEMVKTYKKYHKKGFNIFAVSLDTNKNSWEKAIEKDHLPWKQVSELKPRGKAETDYGIKGIPDNFLIDINGKVIARGLEPETLDKILSKLLNP